MSALVVPSSNAAAIDGRYYPRWHGLPRVVGGNTPSPVGYYQQPVWLDFLKQCGSNSGFCPWFTGNSSAFDTGEEAYVQMDADFNPTSLTAGNGFSGTQQFTKLFTYIFVTSQAFAPTQTSLYPLAEYTFAWDGPGVFQLTGDVSGLATTTPNVSVSGNTVTSTLAQGTIGTVTFSATAGNLGFVITVPAGSPISPSGYLKFSRGYLVQTSLLSDYFAGKILHPNYKAVWQGPGGLARYNGPVRSMGEQMINVAERTLTFTANLAQGATSGTLSSMGWQGGSSTTWPWPNGTYEVMAANGQILQVEATYGSATLSWPSTPLSAAVNTSAPGAMAIVPTLQSWSKRPKPSNLSWGMMWGTPIEVLVQQANELGLPPWINVPAALPFMDTMYAPSFAELVRDGTGAATADWNVQNFTGVSTSLRLFVELTNEIFNFGTGFRQANWFAMMSVPTGYYAANGNSQYVGGYELYGVALSYGQTVNGVTVPGIGLALQSAYGASAYAERVAVVAMTQFATGVGSNYLNATMNTPHAPQPAYPLISAKGCAPYFGTDMISSADAKAIMATANPASTLWSLAWSANASYPSVPAGGFIGGGTISTAQALVSAAAGQPWAGLPWVAYEGGSALDDANNLEQAVNISGITRSPGAGQPTVVTVNPTTSPWAAGDKVYFSAIQGTTQLNGTFATISSVGGSAGAWTYTFNSLDTSADGAWTSNGKVSLGWRDTVLTVAQRAAQMALAYYDPENSLGGTYWGYLEAMRNIGFSFICQLDVSSQALTAASPPGGANWGACESDMQVLAPLASAPHKQQGIWGFAAAGVGS